MHSRSRTIYFLLILFANTQLASNTTLGFDQCPPTFTRKKKCGFCSDFETSCHDPQEKGIQCSFCNSKEACELHPNDCVWFEYHKSKTCRLRENTVYVGFISFIVLFLFLFLILSVVHRILREWHEEHEGVFYFARQVRWVEGRVDVAKGENFWHSLLRNLTQYDPFMKFWVLDDSHFITLFEAYATWVFTFTYAGWASILVRLERESNIYEETFWEMYLKPFIFVSLPCMIIFGISLAIEAAEQRVRLTADNPWQEHKCSFLDLLYHICLLAGAVICSVYGVRMIAHLYTSWGCVVWDLILYGWLIPEILGNFLTTLKFAAAWQDQIHKTSNPFFKICSRIFWKMGEITLSKRMSTEFIMMDWDTTSSPYQWYLLGVNLHPDVAWHEDKTHLSDKPTADMEAQRVALETSRRTMPHGMQSFHCAHLSRRHWLAESEVPRECWDLKSAEDDNFGLTPDMDKQESLAHIASAFTLADGGFESADENEGVEMEQVSNGAGTEV